MAAWSGPNNCHKYNEGAANNSDTNCKILLHFNKKMNFLEDKSLVLNFCLASDINPY